MKNGEDIIGANLKHYYKLGFRRFFILENKSKDKTQK
ncbi:glycosyltransferase family 2 protein [Entomobacter blattae]